MAKVQFSPCDKLTYKVLAQYGCQSAKQVQTCMNRLYNDSYSTGSIGASLRKMAQKGVAASSENERGQKVYWITDFGKECAKDYED
jgi:DNA-binding PadR family transcriptional regulator